MSETRVVPQPVSGACNAELHHAREFRCRSNHATVGRVNTFASSVTRLGCVPSLRTTEADFLCVTACDQETWQGVSSLEMMQCGAAIKNSSFST